MATLKQLHRAALDAKAVVDRVFSQKIEGMNPARLRAWDMRCDLALEAHRRAEAAYRDAIKHIPNDKLLEERGNW